METLNLSLKSLKVNQSASEETTFYTASLYLDGKRVAHCKNSGQGGGDHFSWTCDQATAKKITDYADSLYPEYKHVGTLDIVVSDLIAAIESEKWIKRQTKNKVLFLLKGENAESDGYRAIKIGGGSSREWLTDFIKRTHGDNLQVILGGTE